MSPFFPSAFTAIIALENDKSRGGRLGNGLKAALSRNRIVVFVIIVIAALTLRGGGGGMGTSGCLICGERGLADFLSNILLFAPLGCAVALRRGSYRIALLIGIALSLTIEVAQWRLIPGRDANIGDLVANTMGSMLGWTLVGSRWWRPLRRGAMFRACGFALVTIVLLIGALALLRPAFSRSAYFLHWTSVYESLARYSGLLLYSRLGPLEWRDAPRGPLPLPDSVGRWLTREPLQIRFIAGDPPASLAPIVSVSDQAHDEVVFIGADGHDLVYRFRSQAEDLRLDDANLRIPNVFRELAPGDTAELSIAFNTDRYCATLNASSVCGRSFSAGDTWSVLLDPHWRPITYRAFGAFFLWLAFLPTGMVVTTRRALIITTSIIVAGLVFGPRIIGLSGTPWYQTAAAISGVIAGHAVGTRLARLQGQAAGRSHRQFSGS